MTYTTIMDRNIDDNLWPKVILIITQIKNVKSTKMFEGNIVYKAYFKKSPNINYLPILGFIIYIFIHKEK